MRFDPQSSARSSSVLPADPSEDRTGGRLTVGMVIIAVLGSLTTGIWLWTKEKEAAAVASNEPVPQVAQVANPGRGKATDPAEANADARTQRARSTAPEAQDGSREATAVEGSRRAYERGLRSMAKGHHGQAIVHLQDAVRLDPSFADAHYSLGLAYAQLGDHRSAMHQRHRLQKLNPELAGLLRAAVD